MSDAAALTARKSAVQAQQTARIRWGRAALWGLSVVVFVNAWMAYCEYVIRASRLNGSHFPVAVVAAIGALVLIVWPLLTSVQGKSWGLTTHERRIVLLMGLIGGAIPANGLTGFMLGIIATPYYYATPENNWGSFHPYIPGWIVPPDQYHAMRWFFNGLPPGEQIPWNVWWVPLFWWTSFAAAVIGVCLSLSVLLRKQWVEYEKLSYPLVEAGMSLVAGSDDPSGRKPVYKSTLFWIGASVSFTILAWNAISWLTPMLPQINVQGTAIEIIPGTEPLKTRVNFLTVGLSYFAPQQLLGSLIVAYLIVSVESAIFNRVGLTFSTAGDSWTNTDVGVGWQSFGAMVVFVLWGLWQARRHLAHMFRAAVKGDDDGSEMLSPRTCVLVLLVSSAYFWLWLHQAGMDYSFAAMFVLMTILGYLALGRMIAEAGWVYQRLPISPQTSTVFLLGVEGFSPGTMTAFAFSYSLIANGRGLFMPAIVQATRLADTLKGNVRRIAWLIALSFLVGIAVSVVYTLYLGYTYGAYNFRVYPFSGGNYEAFAHTIRKIENPFGPDPLRMVMSGVGAVIMSGLILIRYRFPLFAFHPLGFVFPFTYLTRFAVFSMSLTWLTKAVLLRLGGQELYRKTQPLFLGLAVGYAFGVALSFLVDWAFFPGSGHTIHSW